MNENAFFDYKFRLQVYGAGLKPTFTYTKDRTEQSHQVNIVNPIFRSLLPVSSEKILIHKRGENIRD